LAQSSDDQQRTSARRPASRAATRLKRGSIRLSRLGPGITGSGPESCGGGGVDAFAGEDLPEKIVCEAT
jgi:hypothetical protein